MTNFDSLKGALPRALDVRARGEGAVVATLVADRRPDGLKAGRRMVVSESGSAEGTIDTALDELVMVDAREALHAHRSRLRSYTLGGQSAQRAGLQEGDVDVFLEVLHRPPSLVVAGCGHIAVPLVKMAKLIDFDVVAIDDRPEFASRERFPDADEILVGPYGAMLARIAIDSQTYVVLVTRGHVHDQACLEQVIQSPAAYIGMIGSKHRVRTVMRHLAESGYDPEKLRQVYAPIGLDIASHTPAEIAVSVIAEIINVRRGGRALSLRGGGPAR